MMDLLLDLGWWGLIYVLFPTALGALAGLPLWLRRRVLLGNAVGSTVIAVVMIAFILQLIFSRLADGFFAQAELLPVGLLVAAGWVNVLLMFFLSGAVEDRVKRRIIKPDDF
jgi:hypothetical protein